MKREAHDRAGDADDPPWRRLLQSAGLAGAAMMVARTALAQGSARTRIRGTEADMWRPKLIAEGLHGVPRKRLGRTGAELSVLGVGAATWAT